MNWLIPVLMALPSVASIFHKDDPANPSINPSQAPMMLMQSMMPMIMMMQMMNSEESKNGNIMMPFLMMQMFGGMTGQAQVNPMTGIQATMTQMQALQKQMKDMQDMMDMMNGKTSGPVVSPQ